MDFSIDPTVNLLATPARIRNVNPGSPGQGSSFESALASIQKAVDSQHPEVLPGSVQIPRNLHSNGLPQIAAQNNNPGNLRFAGQTGATQGVGGFARFDTPEAGYQALLKQVQLDTGRGSTLAQYIAKFAPACENDTELYIRQASQALGVDANTRLTDIDSGQLATFQARKESGTMICQADSPASQVPQDILSVSSADPARAWNYLRTSAMNRLTSGQAGEMDSFFRGLTLLDSLT